MRLALSAFLSLMCSFAFSQTLDENPPEENVSYVPEADINYITKGFFNAQVNGYPLREDITVETIGEDEVYFQGFGTYSYDYFAFVKEDEYSGRMWKFETNGNGTLEFIVIDTEDYSLTPNDYVRTPKIYSKQVSGFTNDDLKAAIYRILFYSK